jgi:High potential iron-sulfur protein
MKTKASKTEARYIDQVDECGTCTMFRPRRDKGEEDEMGECTLVAGSISHDGWCRFFDRKARTIAHEAAEDYE